MVIYNTCLNAHMELFNGNNIHVLNFHPSRLQTKICKANYSNKSTIKSSFSTHMHPYSNWTLTHLKPQLTTYSQKQCNTMQYVHREYMTSNTFLLNDTCTHKTIQMIVPTSRLGIYVHSTVWIISTLSYLAKTFNTTIHGLDLEHIQIKTHGHKLLK